jgi:APA family basic amino acid/polyamine antiporter
VPHVGLVRGLGLLAATSFLVGDVIGTGVFLKTRVMTCNVGSPLTVIAVWVVAGLLSLAGALTYGEIASVLPRAGGDYV